MSEIDNMDSFFFYELLSELGEGDEDANEHEGVYLADIW